MTATTFGTRTLPPPSLLPAEVADRISAHGQARDRVAKAQAELGSARRIGLPQARQRDIEAAADAVERNKPAPKPVHEAKAVAKIAGLERDVAAAELVERRCVERMNAAIEEHASAIAHAAQKRLSAAREKYLGAVAALEEAGEELRLGYALRNWASAPASSWKVRALTGVPIPRHSSDAPDLGSVVDALRQVVEPPRRPPMPSPFGTVATQAEPQAEPEAEPAPAHDFAAELAAGSPPAA